MTQPTACLLIIGNEILSGRTQDTNLNWLAKELGGIGIRVAEARVIPDVPEVIIATVNECRAKYTYLFTTGGIGPTHDDITTECIAQALGVAVMRHPEAERRLLAHYKPEMVNAARMKMADVPEGASLIDNPVSTAPGFHIGNIYVMAGVPSIMRAMLANIKPSLQGGAVTHARTLTSSITEGSIATALGEIQVRFKTVEIGSYPFMDNGKLGTSLVARSADVAQLELVVAEIEALLKSHSVDVTKA